MLWGLIKLRSLGSLMGDLYVEVSADRIDARHCGYGRGWDIGLQVGLALLEGTRPEKRWLGIPKP